MVIVGAGVAGLAAAQHLTEHGLTVTVLEARDRTGGRIFTVRDASTPLPVELGAEFIDVPGGAWDALRTMGGAAYRSVDGMWSIRNRVARRLDINDVAEHVLSRLASPPADDMTFRVWLALQTGISEADAEWALRYVEGFHAVDLDRVGVHWLSHTIQDSAGGGGEHRHQPLGGFDLAAAGLRRMAGSGCDVRLNTIVTDVRWTAGTVDVRSRDASGVEQEPVLARHGIITVPLGVLQHGDVEFHPPIPHVAAARQLARAHVIKVVFRFTTSFWNDAIDFRDESGGSAERKFLMSGEAFPTWWTPSPVVAPMLTAWAGGCAAEQVRQAGDPVDVALGALATMLAVPRRVIDEHLDRWWFHDWDRDPFARSAYSYVPAGAMSHLAALRQAVAGTLLFAGEATAEDGWNGTVDGALESGRRAAREVLSTLDR